jgi:signal transduction histidine kinase
MSIALSSPSPRAARAHALKNCLAVVRAVNRLLESDVSERSRERLARSQDAVDRMLAIIQEDLTADGRTAARDPGYVSTVGVLRDVDARVEDRAHAGGVELLVQAGPGGVAGDGSQLTEAFSNVVLNAIEATPPGGAVLVYTDELADGSQVWTVRDAGPGIPVDVLRRLGTPFMTSRKEGGSGVGFALARQTVEQHGGQLHVRTSEGSGTVASMRLPAMPRDAFSDVQSWAASGS